jgi:hypothetical protein
MNELDDELLPDLAAVLDRTPDEFGLTLSSNKLSEETIAMLH